MAAKPPNLDSLLECPICLSECEDPRVLTCLHTLCLKCLDQHINTSAEGNHFFCPSCRHKCEVPTGGVTSVPKNFFLNSLRDILQQQGSHKKVALCSKFSALQTEQQECSNSGEGNIECEKATVFCVECAEFFCADCKVYHLRFKGFRTHQLIPVSSADASVIKTAVLKRTTPRCDQHSTLPTDMYCDTCGVPVCWKCCLLKHKQHDCHEIEKAAEESRSLLSDLTETAENIFTRLQKTMQDLDVSEQAINADCDEACRQVQENADEVRALVTLKEKSAVQEIGQAKTTALTQLKAAYKEAEINKAAVESLLSYIQALLASEDATSQVVHTPGLQKQLRQHEMAPLPSVTLEVNLERKIQSLSALKAMLGVSVHQTTEPRGRTGGTAPTGAPDSLDGTVPDDMKVPLGSSLLDFNPDVREFISGLVVMGDCVCVTGFEKPYLWIHNMKTSKHKRHTLDGLKARGMTLVRGETLVITDRNKKLHLIKTNQEMKMTEHVIKDIPFEPHGVTADTARDKLIVVNKSDSAIVICDSQGNVESQVKVNNSFRCAAATSDGYVGLDGDGGKLHWLSRNGDVVHTYSESLSYPTHSIVDSLGRVIIADCGHHTLHLVDVNRNLSHYLLGITDPRRVYLDEVNARFYVGYQDNKVRMYKWPFSSLSPSPSGHTSLTHYKLRVELNIYQ